MDYDQDRYWPFKWPSLEQLTEQDRPKRVFLEDAYRAGFKPYLWGTENFSATAHHRIGDVIYRGRTHWEVRLSNNHETISAHVVNFSTAAEAVLGWLHGENELRIVERLDQDLWSKRLPLTRSPSETTNEEWQKIVKHRQTETR